MPGIFDKLNVIGLVSFDDAMELVLRGATAAPAEYLVDGWPYTLEQTKKLIKNDRRYTQNVDKWADSLARNPELIVPIMLTDSRSTIRWAGVRRILKDPDLFGLEAVAQALSVDVGQRFVEDREGLICSLLRRHGENLLKACDSYVYWDKNALDAPVSLREHITVGNRRLSGTFLSRLIVWHRNQGMPWRDLVELPEAGDEVLGLTAYDMLSDGCATLDDAVSLITEMYGYHWGENNAQSIDFAHSLQYDVPYTVYKIIYGHGAAKSSADPLSDLQGFFYTVRDFLEGLGETRLVEHFEDGLECCFSDMRLSKTDLANVAGDMTWIARPVRSYDRHKPFPDVVIAKMVNNLREAGEHKQNLISLYESLATNNARMSQAFAIQLIQETEGKVEFPIIPVEPADFAIRGALGMLSGVTSEQFFASGYNELIASVLRRDSTAADCEINAFTAARLNEVLSGDPRLLSKLVWCQQGFNRHYLHVILRDGADQVHSDDPTAVFIDIVQLYDSLKELNDADLALFLLKNNNILVMNSHFPLNHAILKEFVQRASNGDQFSVKVLNNFVGLVPSLHVVSYWNRTPYLEENDLFGGSSESHYALMCTLWDSKATRSIGELLAYMGIGTNVALSAMREREDIAEWMFKNCHNASSFNHSAPNVRAASAFYKCIWDNLRGEDIVPQLLYRLDSFSNVSDQAGPIVVEFISKHLNGASITAVNDLLESWPDSLKSLIETVSVI